MRQKPLIGLLVVIVIAVVFWMVGGAIGSSVMGGDEFETWRERNFWAYLGIFAAAVVVVTLPVLWFLGRRLEKVFKEQEESAAATKGIGRLAMRAVAGDVAATDHLFDLLENNPVPSIRYQAARGLAMIGRPQVDKELFRQVRYWQVTDKMALITTLKRGNDMRMYGLMRLLAEDRNPQVARRARAALVHIMPRTARMDDYAEKIARPRDAKRAAAARKEAAVRGESADSYPEIPVALPVDDDADVDADAESADTASAAGDSMSPAARAARQAERADEKPPRRRKAARQAADAPPVRPLSTERVGAEPAQAASTTKAPMAGGTGETTPAGSTAEAMPAGAAAAGGSAQKKRRPSSHKRAEKAGRQQGVDDCSAPPSRPKRARADGPDASTRPKRARADGPDASTRPKRRPSSKRGEGPQTKRPLPADDGKESAGG